MQKDPL